MVKKEDELRLMKELIKRTEESKGEFPYVRDLVKELGIDEGRAVYILSKYPEYDYGISALAGWLDKTKLEELKEKLKQ